MIQPKRNIQEGITQFIDSRIYEINTICQAMVDAPGRDDIVYDENTQLATVLPLEKITVPPELVGASFYKVRENISSPWIYNVPVIFPSMTAGELEVSLTFPIVRGTKGVIAYCKFSNETYLETGEEFDPDVTEYFGMNGAYFIPGGMPKTDSLSDINNQKIQLKAKNSGIDSRFEIDTKSGEISISVKGGKVVIDNSGSVTIESGDIKLGSGSSSKFVLHEDFSDLLKAELQKCAGVKIIPPPGKSEYYPIVVRSEDGPDTAFLPLWDLAGKSSTTKTQ